MFESPSPHGRIFIPPPPLEGYFQGWGVGVYKVWPPISFCEN